MLSRPETTTGGLSRHVPEEASTDTRPEPVLRSWRLGLLLRMRHVVKDRTYDQVAEMTGFEPGVVRRYLDYGRPSVPFLAALCRAFDVSPAWMLDPAGTTPRTTDAGRSARKQETKPRPTRLPMAPRPISNGVRH